LEIWLFADRVGTLAPVKGRLNFRHTPDGLSRPNAGALSSSLPLQSGPSRIVALIDPHCVLKIQRLTDPAAAADDDEAANEPPV